MDGRPTKYPFVAGQCKKKVKVCFYIAQYPVRFYTLHFTTWHTCSFQYQHDISGKHSAILQLLCDDYSLTSPPLYIAWYSFIQLTELGRRGENGNAQTSKWLQRRFETEVSRLRVLLPLSCSAPMNNESCRGKRSVSMFVIMLA